MIRLQERRGLSLADFTVSSGSDLKQVEDCLRKWGAVVIPGWVSGADLERLRGDWQAMRDAREEPDCRCVARVGGAVADYAALYRSKPGAGRFSAIEQVFTSRLMSDLADRVVGSPRLFNEEVYATYDTGKGVEIAASHFDKTWNLKFMIYLDDNLSTGGGAFSVHPGSHRLGRRSFRAWFAKHQVDGAIEVGTPAFYDMGNENVPDDLGECVEILAPAGSLMIFSTDVFHRASVLEVGRDRRILRAHTYPGYALPRGGDLLRRSSRQWIRGEEWESDGRTYSRFSVDGCLEYRDFLKLRWQTYARTNPAWLQNFKSEKWRERFVALYHRSRGRYHQGRARYYQARGVMTRARARTIGGTVSLYHGVRARLIRGSAKAIRLINQFRGRKPAGK